MKILTVVFSIGKGGTERAARNFAVAYSDLGHDSRLVYTICDGVGRKSLEEKSISIYYLNDKNSPFIIKDWRPDIVHIHSHGLSEEAFYKIRNLVPTAKFIETNVFSRPTPWVKHIYLSFQLSLWCDFLYKKRSKNKYSSTIIPNPIDVSSFHYSGKKRVRDFRESYGINIDDLVIGRIGQQFDGKWSLALIDIFDSLKKSFKKLKLVIVNPPESILIKAKKSPYKHDIVIIDQILGDSNLADCYSSIDVFVHIAEQGESFGMVLAESLLCRTPIVTLATPWADNSQGEVVGNLIGGFVATNKKDVLPLVKKLIEDSCLRARMGRDGRNRIIDLFESKIVASNALLILEKYKKNINYKSPNEMMQVTEGRLGLFSRIILSSKLALLLLRYTTGYTSMVYFPLVLLRALFRRLQKLGEF